jgi:hypothetical protein
MLAFMTAAYHEAGHAVMAWVHSVPIRWATIRATEEHAGCNRFAEIMDDISDVDFAAILVAGEIADRIHSFRPLRFNWFEESTDAEKARWFCDQTADPLGSRRAAEAKASVGLRHRWDAVVLIAEQLEWRSLVFGEDVDRLCREAGARRPAEQRPKPFDPDHAFNERRARSALEERAGK